MENLEHYNIDESFADPSKIQTEVSKDNMELKKKQAQELAERRRKYNEEINDIRDRQLKERAEKEESNAKKLSESRKALRRERQKEYESSRKDLTGKDPNKKAREYKTLKDQLNPNSEFRGAGRLLQWTGTANAAKRFINTTQGNYSDGDENIQDLYSDSITGKISKWLSEKEKQFTSMDGQSSIPHSIERDELIINGFLPDIRIIEDVDDGRRPKDRYYLEALDRILEFKRQSDLKNSKSKDRTYSAWELLSRYCG